MTRFLFLVFLISASGSGASKTENYIFTSIDNLATVFESYSLVADAIVQHAALQKDQNPLFEQFASSYEKVNSIPQEEQKKFLGNPVNAFIFIRMLTEDLKSKIPKLNLDKDTRKKLEAQIKEVKTRYADNFPTRIDLLGAAKALNRLIITYRYKIKDIAIGKFNEKSRSIFPLDGFDGLFLGEGAIENLEFHLAYAWANHTQKQLEKDNSSPFVTKRDHYKFMSQLSQRQGNPYMTHMYMQKILEENPDDADIKKELKKYIQNLADVNMTVEDGKHMPLDTKRNLRRVKRQKLTYESLCRDQKDELLPVKPLQCRYLNDHPFLVIGPVKEEKIYDDPPMWIYYDTLTEKQADHLKAMALPKLSRAKIGDGTVSNIRITQSYQIKTDKTLQYLDAFLTAITKLSMKEAEHWQIANYGLGGQYEPHTDHRSQGELIIKNSGDRFATWLNYIEAPEIGGDTVFVNLRIKTKAISRSSVFWYNLNKNLTGNENTRHAACPVVLGSKWVNNKWIRQNDQMFTKPCSLTP